MPIANHQRDPNELLDVIKSYLKLKGSPKELSGFESLVKQYPESKHAHNGLAMAYYEQFKMNHEDSEAKQALQEEIQAAKIAYSYGEVLFVSWIKQMAIDANQPEQASGNRRGRFPLFSYSDHHDLPLSPRSRLVVV